MQYAIKSLLYGPKSLRGLLETLSREDLDRSLGEDRFTPREIIAHMVDSEPIFLERIKKAVETPGYEVVPFDVDERAKEQKFSQQDVSENIAKYLKLREETVEFVKSLSEEQLNCDMNHPQWGHMTINDFVSLLLAHDLYHVEQLTQYLPSHVSA